MDIFLNSPLLFSENKLFQMFFSVKDNSLQLYVHFFEKGIYLKHNMYLTIQV